MNVKLLALGVAVGFLIAVAPSCGGSKACGPQNCGGCCDANGACVAKETINDLACGTRGAACVNCTTQSPAQTCNTTSASCQAGTTGGGTGGGAATGGGEAGTGGGTTTGGGTGGGSTGGGTGGGGGTAAITCDISTQNCPSGQSCMVSSSSPIATTCRAGACDLVTQNCPTSTDTCTYASATPGGAPVRTCVPATGTAVEGATCATADACAKGLACVGGTCAKFCYPGRPNDCPSGKVCSGSISINGLTTEFPTICDTACDALAQNCGNGQACYPIQGGAVCQPPGTTANGQACTSPVNCLSGSACIGVQTSPSGPAMNQCVKLCNTDGGMPSCSTGTCRSLTGAPFGGCL